MRNISFSMTKDQVRARTKTVTRRVGWLTLKPGAILQGVEKAQGLRKGEHVMPLATIRVVDVRRERLSRMMHEPHYGFAEVVKEGFSGMAPGDFVAWFAESHGCSWQDDVTRIEFEYVD